MSIKIKQLPETERPYEKLELYGEKVLSNAELLAIIIKSGIRNESSVTIAQRILNLDSSKKNNLDFLKEIGIREENLRYRDHAKEELVFYSKATTDIEYKYPMGWGELWGIADRTDYDLTVHQEHSKTDMRYLDPETNEK